MHVMGSSGTQAFDQALPSARGAPRFDPNHSALSVLVGEWRRDAFCIFKDPREDTLLWDRGQARHAMTMNMLEKRWLV